MMWQQGATEGVGRTFYKGYRPWLLFQCFGLGDIRGDPHFAVSSEDVETPGRPEPISGVARES